MVYLFEININIIFFVVNINNDILLLELFSLQNNEISFILILMKLKPDYEPEFESLKEMLVDLPRERSLDILLDSIVRSLANRPHVALAGIWLVLPGDDCFQCRSDSKCTDHSKCLHLAASAGCRHVENSDYRSVSDFPERRIPIGERSPGRVSKNGKPLRITAIDNYPKWVSKNTWAKNEKIQGYGIQPLIHKGKTLGIISIYSRIHLDRVKEGTFWLRLISNFAAFAIANSRAFEQIETLKAQLEIENAYLREEISKVHSFGDIIGISPPLMNVLQQIELVAPTDASVLILGESGTGKELVAREIHKRSLRKKRPMIKVNCATIPGDLYESEFFGHIKGAFTGAVNDRAGRFQAANDSTLFLDEVGEIPLPLQSKLLRVLQEGHYERIGEDITRQANVRIIAATNRDIKQEIETHRFRQDLYYRLNVFPIELAPLNRRKEDIPLLTEHFLNLVAEKMNRSVPRLTKANIRELQNYTWPGNIRELQNIIERAVITSRNGFLKFNLPKKKSNELISAQVDHGRREHTIFTDEEINSKVRSNIISALRKTKWKIYGHGGAAALLGIKPTTLTSRMKKMNIKKPK